MAAFYKTGEYWGEITDHGITESEYENVVTQQIFVEFLVLGPVNPSNPDEYMEGTAQYKRKLYGKMTREKIKSTLEVLDLLGFRGTSFAEFSRQSTSYQDLVGNAIKVRCSQFAPQGTLREYWFVVDPSKGGPVEPLPVDGIAKLDQLFGRDLKDHMRGKTKPVPQSNPAEPPTDIDAANADLTAEANAAGEDIPF
jgi:hypothetical protein